MHIRVKSVFYCLKNPYSNIVEYIAATNQILANEQLSTDIQPCYSKYISTPQMTPSPEENKYENRTYKFQQQKLPETAFTKNIPFKSPRLNHDLNLAYDKSMENFQIGGANFSYVSSINKPVSQEQESYLTNDIQKLFGV